MSERRRGPAVGRYLLLARLGLAWEALWPATWPATGLIAAFTGFALFDGFSWLPGWAHAAALLLTAGLTIALLFRGMTRISWPRRGDALRRLETESNLDHRPLQALEDSLPDEASDPVTRALWRTHQKRTAGRLRSLKAGLPAPGLPARDPWAVRTGLALLVLVGAVVAGPDLDDRLKRAVMPQFGVSDGAQTARLELWITPPEYTRLPPVFPARRTGAGEADSGIDVPEGSVLTAIVSGGTGEAALEFGDARTPFEIADPVNRKLERPIAGSGVLTVLLDGKPLGSWRIRSIPDVPPRISFDGPPKPLQRGSLRIAYQGEDDYGIAEIRGEMRRTYERGTVVGKEVFGFELPTPPSGAREFGGTSLQEIAAHPWAGLPVAIRLTAADAAGQRSWSEEVKIVLPEREFHNPVARRVVAERRRLTTEPERRAEIMQNIGDIASRPETFGHDTVAFMGLAFARSRLLHEKGEAAESPVRDLLWDTALRIEDGQLSHAERELLRAQRALAKALERNAGDEELERLMRELQTALNRYLRELARTAENAGEPPPLNPAARLLQSTDLQRMMEQIRQMMRSGARDAARRMLGQLRRMLETLRNARVMRADPNALRGNRAFRQLQNLIRRQGQLLDRTFRMSQEGRGDAQSGLQEQKALREMLRRLRQALRESRNGSVDGALDRAGREMDGAARALGRSRPGEAVGPQGQALEALRRAGRGMMRDMMNRFGRGMEGDFNPLRTMRDPLGRELPNEDGVDTRSVDIPERGAIERAQEIIEELRRRAGQRHRSRFELDYINRLLERF